MGFSSAAGLSLALGATAVEDLSEVLDGLIDANGDKLRVALNGPRFDPSNGAVIFDCDGTLLDTEKLRSEVTFLLLAPHMPGLEKWEGSFQDWKEVYIMKAAGRSFKQKGEDVDAQRKEAGLPCIGDCWVVPGGHPQVLECVRQARVALKLPEKPAGGGLQEAKWIEDDLVLKRCSEPCVGMTDVVAAFKAEKIPYCIASTSSQDSLKASLKAAGMLQDFVPAEERIHSGESDFVPSAHKPKPDVFLKAAAALGVNPKDSVAIEDSDSGVGSAANAGFGLIVGFVGGGQIPTRMQNEAAKTLMSGRRSQDGRGADIVISHGDAFLPLVTAWRAGMLSLPIKVLPNLGEGLDVWLPNLQK